MSGGVRFEDIKHDLKYNLHMSSYMAANVLACQALIIQMQDELPRATPKFRLDPVERHSVIMTGTRRSNTHARFKIFWVNYKQCFVFVEEGTGYATATNSAHLKKILIGKIPLRQIDAFCCTRENTIEYLAAFEQQQRMDLERFIKIYNKKRQSVRLSTFIPPYMVISGKIGSSESHVVHADGAYEYFELNRNGSLLRHFSSKTPRGLLSSMNNR